MILRLIAGLGLAAILVGAGILIWTWVDDDDDAQSKVLAELSELAEIAPPSPDAPDDFPAIVDAAVREPSSRTTPQGATFQIIETIPHDTEAFTQGLEIADDRLFESTGLRGSSSIREVDIETGAVIRSLAVDDVFAEGLTIVDDTAIQLTWQAGIAYRYDLETFERIESYSYEGEGWGLCDDGERLIMSNGTPTLQFRDRVDFSLLGSVEVRYDNVAIDELNELECVDGRVWSNIWHSSLIIEIDPASGSVTTVLNARSLTPPSVEGSTSSVLNGIAYDAPTDTFLLTGKRWPTMYRVRIDSLPQ